MLRAGSACCSMFWALVQSPDTHGRVVATLVCLQHLGSRSRFARVRPTFLGAYCWTSYFSFRFAAECLKRVIAVSPTVVPAVSLDHLLTPIWTLPILLNLLMLWFPAPLFSEFRKSVFKTLLSLRSTLPMISLTLRMNLSVNSATIIRGSSLWQPPTSNSSLALTAVNVKTPVLLFSRRTMRLLPALYNITFINGWMSPSQTSPKLVRFSSTSPPANLIARRNAGRQFSVCTRLTAS